ncbi:MAG: hypothetical protein QOG61_1931 [Candidatus Binataceae bacterium]|jgi:hypothetical protein|nr:hypothetical protein [Candidatus Binataceae bacterium]
MTSRRAVSALSKRLERGVPQTSLAGDVAVFDLGDQLRLEPGSLRLPDGVSFDFGVTSASRRLRRSADVALVKPVPTLQFLAIPLAQRERRDASWVLDEANDREFVALRFILS